ncbi:MAG: beta-propeller domain-containing protein, partial [Candidatus Bathyarchaeota archaeon]|nr:beta-propeller domain-containing protein [Candidatus Bathyarchaeota archaeon]
MNRFTSYDELKEYLTEYSSGYGDVYVRGFGFSDILMAPMASDGAKVFYEDTASIASQAAGSNDYSGTNIQVEGVDEADVVKTD